MSPKSKSGGYTVSKCHLVNAVVIVACALVAVGVMVYFYADRAYPQAAASTGTAMPPTTTEQPMKPVRNVRLPRTVLPRHYDIRLLPIIEKGNFSIYGDVSIDLECKGETDRIVLHSADITVDATSVKVFDQVKNQNIVVKGVEYDKEVNFLIIELALKDKGKLRKGYNYTLSMAFTGRLNDELRGFYRSSYIEEGVEKYLATTQMEPVDARRAFPCFDEPNMKAEFTITLGRRSSMTALSNMPLVNTTAIEGMPDYHWDHFARSVPMSTYLVAMIVADFHANKADSMNSAWNFTIYARPSARNQTEYASEIGPKILAFYEDYFQVPYPLPKQDMIAIPDFSAGAMENWGLITYRETALLYDEKISSASNKQRVAVVIAHELAHQWFGNLVTMDWWSDLWLNEGFASYVEFIGTNHAEPAYEMFQQIVTDDVQDVMGLDALESSHPISVVVNHPDEINELFDRISYGKGASIIRMMANIIGEKTFKEGLTNYLKSRSYDNAVQDYLWDAFTQQAKVNNVSLPTSIKEMMDTWTLKMGYPVITVNRNYRSQTVSLTQERFLLQRRSNITKDSIDYRWWVPLTYTADFETIGSTWLANNQTSKMHTLEFPIDDEQWLIFNIDEIGYFRVNYDRKNWQLISQQLMKNHSAISVINRAQIMDDSLNLAQAGILDYDLVLNLTNYLVVEDEYLPWQSALSSLKYIASMMSRSSGYGHFKRHMKKLLLPVYSLVGFNDSVSDAHLTIYKRINAVSWVCSMGHSDCVDNAVSTYKRWMADSDNNSIVSSNLKRTIACTAIREGGEEEWDFAFKRYNETNVATEKAALLSAMSCSQQAWILGRMLEWTLDPKSGIRRQDGSAVFSQVASNSLGRYIAFNFLRDRWVDIKGVFKTLSSLARIVDAVTRSFNTELELKELLQFREEHQEELGNSARTVQQSVDRTKNNVAWMKQNYAKVVQWLERNY